MDFTLSDEQRMLQREARAVLDDLCPPAAVRTWLRDGTARPPELWRRMAELGWLGLALPAELGGSGAGLVDLVLLHEACGAALVPTLFRTTTWAALAVLAAADGARAAHYLPLIARGEKTATVALPGWGAPGEAVLSERSGNITLTGRCGLVENGGDADWLIVPARHGAATNAAVGLVVVPRTAAGVRVARSASFAGEPQAEVVFDAVALALDAVFDDWRLDAALQGMATLLCADMVGGFGRVVELTIAYVKEREQFGRPIGSFQAVQHQLADMATALEGARWATYQAAWCLEQGRDATREVAIAQAWTAPAYKAATLTAHQLHGGMGFVTEYDLYLYSDRAKAQESRLGTLDRHLECIARELDL